MKNISGKVRLALYRFNFVREFAEAIVERKKPEESFEEHPAQLYQLGGQGLWTGENIILFAKSLKGTDRASKEYDLAYDLFESDFKTSLIHLKKYIELLNKESGFSNSEKTNYGLIFNDTKILNELSVCLVIDLKSTLKQLYFPKQQEFSKPVYIPKNKNFYQRICDDIACKTGW